MPLSTAPGWPGAPSAPPPAECTVWVDHENGPEPGPVAFFLRLRVVNLAAGPAGPEPVLPAFYEDNYLTLLPGEARRIRVDFALPAAPPPAGAGAVAVQLCGYNVGAAVVPVRWSPGPPPPPSP